MPCVLCMRRRPRLRLPRLQPLRLLGLLHPLLSQLLLQFPLHAHPHLVTASSRRERWVTIVKR